MRFLCLFFLALVLFGLGAALWFFRHGSRPDFETHGGTVLVYEVDTSKFPNGKVPDSFRPEELAAALQRRIDPAGLANVTIRVQNPDRVEIRIPRAGPNHANQVRLCKEMVAQAGVLEFRILANRRDDRAGIEAARKFFADPKNRSRLEKATRAGLPPPSPPPPEAAGFPTTRHELGKHRYSWVEVSNQQRHEMGLANPTPQELKDPNKANPGPDDLKDPNSRQVWVELARAREKKIVFDFSDWGETLLWSRDCIAEGLPEKDRTKKWEYFILVRDPEPRAAVTGDYLFSVNETQDSRGQLAVGFHFNERGGRLLYDLTSKNVPKGDTDEAGFRRHLAIILDHQVMSAPRLNQAIRTDGIIEGRFTKEQVDLLVSVLRAGALPATLKPQPVSETEVEPQRR